MALNSSNYVRQRVQEFCDTLEQIAKKSTSPEHHVAGLRDVTINGKRINDDQLALLEQQYKLNIVDGTYWYDRICGAWGFWGGPCLGFVLSNLDLGGALAPNASNGNTGVFINGRQLHQVDVANAQRLTGQVLPGRWWVDANGNFGVEGGMMFGNLWCLAQQHQSTGHNWSRTSSVSGVTVGGGEGLIYAQGRDALGNPFFVSTSS